MNLFYRLLYATCRARMKAWDNKGAQREREEMELNGKRLISVAIEGTTLRNVSSSAKL